MEILKILGTLPQAVTSDYGLVAFVATLIAWAFISYRTRRLDSLLGRLKQVPAGDRADLIRAEMDAVVPKEISAEQWIQSRKHRYFFIGFLAVCGLVVVVTAIAVLAPDPEELLAGMEDLRDEVKALASEVTERSINASDLTLTVQMNTAEVERLQAATGKMERLADELKRSVGRWGLAEDNALRLRRAEAAIQQNRGLIYFNEGDVTRGVREFSGAIDTLLPLVDEGADQELIATLGATLHARGAARFGMEQNEDAKEDLERAAQIFQYARGAAAGDVMARAVNESLRTLRVAAAVVVKPAAIPAITLKELTRNGAPEIERVFIVEAGVDPNDSFSPKLVAETLGAPMLVDPGTYDVVLKPARQNFRLTILKSVAVKAGEQVIVDSNALASSINVTPLTRGGFPQLKQVSLALSSTVEESERPLVQQTDQIGTALLVAPGEYDLLCETEEEMKFTLARQVKVEVGQSVTVDANAEAGAIVVRDPKMPGLELESVLVLRAGTPLQGTSRVIQEAESFEQPMMVYAGGVYDVYIRQVNAQPVKIAADISPQRGQLTYVGGE